MEWHGAYGHQGNFAEDNAAHLSHVRDIYLFIWEYGFATSTVD